MTDKAIDKQILNYFHALAKPEQLSVLNYLKSLLNKDRSSNKNLLKLAGSISSEDIELIEKAIKENCEKIDEDEW